MWVGLESVKSNESLYPTKLNVSVLTDLVFAHQSTPLLLLLHAVKEALPACALCLFARAARTEWIRRSLAGQTTNGGGRGCGRLWSLQQGMVLEVTLAQSRQTFSAIVP